MPVDWERLLGQLAGYESAVLNGLDAGGYPYSVRCRPKPTPPRARCCWAM